MLWELLLIFLFFNVLVVWGLFTRAREQDDEMRDALDEDWVRRHTKWRKK